MHLKEIYDGYLMEHGLDIMAVDATPDEAVQLSDRLPFLSGHEVSSTMILKGALNGKDFTFSDIKATGVVDDISGIPMFSGGVLHFQLEDSGLCDCLVADRHFLNEAGLIGCMEQFGYDPCDLDKCMDASPLPKGFVTLCRKKGDAFTDLGYGFATDTYLSVRSAFGGTPEGVSGICLCFGPKSVDACITGCSMKQMLRRADEKWNESYIGYLDNSHSDVTLKDVAGYILDPHQILNSIYRVLLDIRC